MYWILAAVFLVIALAVPRLRPVGVIGCIILGVLLAWGVVQRLRAPADVQERGRPTSPAVALQAIPPKAVVVHDPELAGGGAPFELRGRIENTSSDTQLRSVTILVTRRDCYEGALDPSGCAVLWQDRHWLTLSVPPGEARDFSSSIWMRGAAPRPRGTMRDTFEIVAAAGEAAPERAPAK